jgi:hypothetical protein
MATEQKQIWLEEALALVPAAYHPEYVRPYLESALKRCHSNSRKAFWQWLRLALAKSPESAAYLTDMQESRLPAEVAPKTFDDFKYTVSADGTTALIPVHDADVQMIWKIPIAQLGWARSIMPVFLKRLPDLEPPEVARQRQIRHQSHYLKAKLSYEQLQSLEKELNDLDEQVARLYKPIVRYCLLKWTPKQDIPVHRLFVGVDEDSEVEAINGDFLDFTNTKVRMILEPVADKDGIAGGRGETETRIVEIPNLQGVPRSEEQQAMFEKGMLQFKWTMQGDISQKPLRVLPNADLGKRTWNGDTGRIEDCGKHFPSAETYSPERFARRASTLNPDVIRARWRGF